MKRHLQPALLLGVLKVLMIDAHFYLMRTVFINSHTYNTSAEAALAIFATLSAFAPAGLSIYEI
jgi:hypothetical protein